MPKHMIEGLCLLCRQPTSPVGPDDDLIVFRCIPCRALFNEDNEAISDVTIEDMLDVHCYEYDPEGCKYCYVRSLHQEFDPNMIHERGGEG